MAIDFVVLMSFLAHIVLQLTFITRAILRPHREASSRAAWVLVILSMPIVGMIAYVLFGETNIGQKRLQKYDEVQKLVEGRAAGVLTNGDFESVSAKNRHLFKLGQTVNQLGPLGGNVGELLGSTDAAFDRLVEDIDQAKETVHLLFYIWLEDTNGLKVAEAAKRAARRGVNVRAMADDIGSRSFIRSKHWEDMQEAGVQTARALPVSKMLLHPIRGRVDLRNHRKIAVVDSEITYSGSANCADPEFKPKARFGPWVDTMVRFVGPVALQSQYLFVIDWMAHTEEDLTFLLDGKCEHNEGLATLAIGTGPTTRNSAMPEMFEVLFHAARHELLVTTPYYVPSDAMHDALCLTARRGVRTTLVLPKKNDSWVVAAASRSYYRELVEAGVQVYEYPLGLLHAKILTVDREIALIGSANLDRRSFELNYENNVLLEDAKLSSELAQRQESYVEASSRVALRDIEAWSSSTRMWHNGIAMMGPIL